MPRSDMQARLAVLISGRGSNLQAIIDATRDGRLDATIAVVVSNRADAPGLARAREAGIEALHLSPKTFADRDAYDRAIADQMKARGVTLVCLAGYMRLVGAPLLEAFPNRVLNIHPSLLPSFRGLDAQRQALEHGVAITGATVHIVNADLDAGPIVMQAAVPVMPDDTVESLAARILVQEHRIYPLAIAKLLGQSAVADRQSSVISQESPDERGEAAVVEAIPFARDEAVRVVQLRAGADSLTELLRERFPRAAIKTFEASFDVASLSWWDTMFGADLVIAAFAMPKLTEAKTQYLYKAAADRVSPRGGLLVLDRVGEGGTVLLHQLIWLRHAGFADVDCRWRVGDRAVLGGFRPSRPAAPPADDEAATARSRR